MLLVTPVSNDKRHRVDNEEQLVGMDKLRAKRSDIPAVTHVDYSSRVQTVTKKDNPFYYDMIKKFEERHGCPLIINTSFNVSGANQSFVRLKTHYHCFMRTDMDYLIMVVIAY